MTNKKLKKLLTNPFNCAILIYDEMKKGRSHNATAIA